MTTIVNCFITNIVIIFVVRLYDKVVTYMTSVFYVIVRLFTSNYLSTSSHKLVLYCVQN